MTKGMYQRLQRWQGIRDLRRETMHPSWLRARKKQHGRQLRRRWPKLLRTMLA